MQNATQLILLKLVSKEKCKMYITLNKQLQLVLISFSTPNYISCGYVTQLVVSKIPLVLFVQLKKTSLRLIFHAVQEIKFAGYLNVAADFTHNFTDGLVAIEASYLVSDYVAKYWASDHGYHFDTWSAT